MQKPRRESQKSRPTSTRESKRIGRDLTPKDAKAKRSRAFVADATQAKRTSSWPLYRWGTALAIILVTLIISLVFYPKLPASMPVDFNAEGMPVSFASRRWGAFVNLIYQVVCVGLFAVAHWLLSRPQKPDARGFFSLWQGYPPNAQKVLAPKVSILLDGLLLALLLLFLQLQYTANQLALGNFDTIRTGAWLIRGFIVIWTLSWAVALSRESRDLKQKAERKRRYRQVSGL